MYNYENSWGKLIGVSIVPWLPLFGMCLSSSIYAGGKALNNDCQIDFRQLPFFGQYLTIF